MKFQNQESGRSMIEMLGVLAIMGVITVAAIAMITAAMRSAHRSSVQDQVTQIATGVRSLLGGFDDFSGIDNATIFAAIGVSSKNPYNGDYILATHPTDPRLFVLSITGLNRSDCQYFRTKAWIDSFGFQTSDGRNSGAEADPVDCTAFDGRNTIRIVFN
jgi:type II secretory pathway pseudopilin PulG